MNIPAPSKLVAAFAIAIATVTTSGAAIAACTVQPDAERLTIKQLVESAMGRSTAVFTGKVTAIDDVPAARTVSKQRRGATSIARIMWKWC